MGVVTFSAAYGAAGAEVAPAVAERLGLPFHDRAIPAQVAGRLGVSVEEAEANDETVVRGLTPVWQGRRFARVEARRAEAYVAVNEALSSSRYRHLLIDLCALLA